MVDNSIVKVAVALAVLLIFAGQSRAAATGPGYKAVKDGSGVRRHAISLSLPASAHGRVSAVCWWAVECETDRAAVGRCGCRSRSGTASAPSHLARPRSNEAHHSPLPTPPCAVLECPPAVSTPFSRASPPDPVDHTHAHSFWNAQATVLRRQNDTPPHTRGF